MVQEGEKMNIAVVGAGYWGRNLVRVFSELGSLSAVCDFNAKTLGEVKRLYPQAGTTASYSEVLTNPGIDGIVISTPAATHYNLVKQGLLAGKDIFVEKPLALTVKDGKELVDIAEKKDKILMVGHLLEYHPGILKLKELIDKGVLGHINYIYSNRLNLGKIRREENILWSFAPHDISVMLFLLGEMPISVSAYGGNYLHKNIADVTVSNLEFKSGVKGHIFVSWLHPYKEQKLIVIGDKKMALFDDVEKKDKLRLYSYKVEMKGEIPVSTKDAAEPVDFEALEPLKEECRHFLHCLKTRQRPRTDGHNGLRVLKILQACQHALENQGRDKVEIEDESIRKIL